MRQHPVACFVVPAFHQSEWDVGQILDPFKIADDDTAGVDVQIREDGDAARPENSIGLKRRRAVGSFSDEFCLNALGVFGVDDTFRLRLGTPSRYDCPAGNALDLRFRCLVRHRGRRRAR